jgi:hypothetical protein
MNASSPQGRVEQGSAWGSLRSKMSPHRDIANIKNNLKGYKKGRK